jgi:hypothetical protein
LSPGSIYVVSVQSPPRLAIRSPRPPPSRFGPAPPRVRPNRPIRPSLFIGHQAPPARIPRVAAARVRRPPCTATAHVHRHPPIVDHAHSPPTLSRAVPPSSSAVDLGHQICADLCAAHRRFRVEQACRRPSSPDPPGATPPSPGRTLHHDPPGDTISALEIDVIHGRADATGCATLRAGSAPHSESMRRTSLLGGPPYDPWEGHRRKTRNALRSNGSPSPTVTTDNDVDPPLLPCPTMSTAASGDPLPTARLPPILRVVTDCLECCYGARVWLQERLSGVVTDCL